MRARHSNWTIPDLTLGTLGDMRQKDSLGRRLLTLTILKPRGERVERPYHTPTADIAQGGSIAPIALELAVITTAHHYCLLLYLPSACGLLVARKKGGVVSRPRRCIRPPFPHLPTMTSKEYPVITKSAGFARLLGFPIPLSRLLITISLVYHAILSLCPRGTFIL